MASSTQTDKSLSRLPKPYWRRAKPFHNRLIRSGFTHLRCRGSTPRRTEKNRIRSNICVATAFGGARAATIFVAETIARPGQQALCLGVRHRALAMRIRRRLVRRVGVTASLGAMFGASNVVLFAVMFGGSAMRLGCRFVKFGCLCIMSLGHNFSSMESLH